MFFYYISVNTKNIYKGSKFDDIMFNLFRKNQPTEEEIQQKEELKRLLDEAKAREQQDLSEKMQDLAYKSAEARGITAEKRKIERERQRILAEIELEKAREDLRQLREEQEPYEPEEEQNSLFGGLGGTPLEQALLMGVASKMGILPNTQQQPMVQVPQEATDTPRLQVQYPEDRAKGNFEPAMLEKVATMIPQEQKEFIKRMNTNDLETLKNML